MPILVYIQMIDAAELLVAHLAFVRLEARVLALVSGQLVHSGKTPLALGPLAHVRLFACVHASVRCQMSFFCVRFHAAFYLVNYVVI